LISKLLVKNIDLRLSAHDAFQHKWVQGLNPNAGQPLPQEIISNITRFVDAKEMKQAVLMYMACKLTEQELHSLKEIFKMIDRDGDGVITAQELDNALAVNTKIPQKRLEYIVSGVDINKNGQIDYTEFIASCLGRHIYGNIVRASAAFNYFDRDKDGFITADELKKALFDNEEISIHIDEKVEKMIHDADTNGDGQIDYMEFLALLSMHTLRYQ
jgi:calcium-dependent protein kinase